PPNYQLFDAMLDGGEIELSGCGADTGPNGCLEPEPQTTVLEGFQERARRLLLGDDTTPGIIAKLRANDQEFNDEELALLSNLPRGAGGMLIRTTSLSEDAGRTFAEALMPHLTTEWARIVSDDLIEAVAASITLVDSEHAREIQRLVDQARNRLNVEVQRRQGAQGPISAVLSDYTTLLAVTDDVIFASPADPTERP
ncbi:MAG: conjugal transfer protein TraH, partial [Geminicoccaceae bacterium]